MRKTLLVVLGFVVIGGAAVVGWLLFFKAPSPASGDSVVLRLKWLHQAQFAGFYVAEKRGLYQESGMNVTINPGGVDFPAIQMVAGGSEDFGVTGADQILLARAKGVPVIAVAVIYRRTPFVLFSLTTSGITKPADLVGRRVGVKLGGNEELTYRALLKKQGLDEGRITEVPVKYDMSPLFSGLVDVWPGYAINEPIVAREKGHPVNIINPNEYGVSLYADTLFTTERMIREKPDVVRRFVQATAAGWVYATEHPVEAAEYGLLFSDKLNRPHEVAMMKASIPLLNLDAGPFGVMEPEDWEEMQSVLLETGFLKGTVDTSAAFSNDFLQ